MSVELTFEDHSDEILAMLNAKADRALEEIGLTAEKYAVMLTPTDTGRLKNSITHTVKDKTVYIGTNVFYAPYIEYGTGIYAENGKGRRGWWVYVKGSTRAANPDGVKKIYTEAEARKIAAIMRSRGLDAFATNGVKAVHMLRNAITRHIDEYKRIVKKHMTD